MTRRTKNFVAIAFVLMAGMVFWLVQQTMASRHAEGNLDTCTDGVDNDWNGRVDCDDPSCGRSDDPTIRDHCRVILLEKSIGATRVAQSLTELGDDLSRLERASWQTDGTVLGRISQSGSRIQLVSFWASYCIPCVREWPSMMKLSQQLGPQKLSIISISYDEDWASTSRFFRSSFGFLPSSDQSVVLRDPASDPKDMKKTVFGTEKIPENYVVMDGKILYRFVSERDWHSPAMVRFFEGLIYGQP